ncbi:MAG TPA: LLM class flavin-dependent oxidoreductase, partial [Myxococcota bacterium]|nr:LLM class flavin-dependent oxidoreductase [Myxococcota bacterium]
MDPVVDQRQRAPLRVGDVDARVHQALAEPEQADRGVERLAFAAEVHGRGDREDELPERPAEELHRPPEDAEEHVPRLVEEQVHAVEEVVAVPEDEPDRVRDQREKEDAAAAHAPSSAGRRPACTMPTPERGGPPMRVETTVPLDNWRKVAEVTQRAEAAGFDGIMSAEISNDPFIPLAFAALASERIQIGTAIAVAFPRSPMVVANTCW